MINFYGPDPSNLRGKPVRQRELTMLIFHYRESDHLQLL